MGVPGFGLADHAVLVGVDGLSVRALHHALSSGMAPTIAHLRRTSAFTDDARCVQPSLSLPNWASVLFGAPPSLHGVHLGNVLDDALRPATLEQGMGWPDLFSSARFHKNELTTAAFYSWPPLSQLMPRQGLNVSVLMPCMCVSYTRSRGPQHRPFPSRDHVPRSYFHPPPPFPLLSNLTLIHHPTPLSSTTTRDFSPSYLSPVLAQEL